jgi:hypothetical protein
MDVMGRVRLPSGAEVKSSPAAMTIGVSSCPRRSLRRPPHADCRDEGGIEALTRALTAQLAKPVGGEASTYTSWQRLASAPE